MSEKLPAPSSAGLLASGSTALRILIVDDDQMMARTLRDILRVKGYQVEMAYGGPEAMDMVERQVFDCVLSDIKMPQVSGVDLYRTIEARRPDLPVVLMTAYSTAPLVQEGLNAGAIAVIEKPLDISLLLGFFSSFRRERPIAIVDDDPQFCQTLGDLLRARGFAVLQITEPHGVSGRAGSDGEIALLDMRLGGANGLDVLQEVRQRHPHLPVLLVTGYRQEMTTAIEAALEIGAYTCFYKPFQIEKLLHALTQIHHRELRQMLDGPARKKR